METPDKVAWQMIDEMNVRRIARVLAIADEMDDGVSPECSGFAEKLRDACFAPVDPPEGPFWDRLRERR